MGMWIEEGRYTMWLGNEENMRRVGEFVDWGGAREGRKWGTIKQR